LQTCPKILLTLRVNETHFFICGRKPEIACEFLDIWTKQLTNMHNFYPANYMIFKAEDEQHIKFYYNPEKTEIYYTNTNTYEFIFYKHIFNTTDRFILTFGDTFSNNNGR
jgi:hypothetical protein